MLTGLGDHRPDLRARVDLRGRAGAGRRARPTSDTPLLEVVAAGAPDLPIDEIFPFISMFAVANSALINMLMASRLLYGMAKQEVLPPFARQGAPGAADAVGGDHLHDGASRSA